MKAKQKIAALILLCIFSLTSGVSVQTEMKMKEMPADHIMVMPADIKWGPSPPGLPAGAQTAVIEGNPANPGLFTMRAKIPAGFKIMPHSHPADEHITVLEGSCYMGLGDKYDEKEARKMVTGAFGVMNVGTRHYFFTREACTIQLHGMGPWGITYVNPADDPRNKK
jgi:quercetin dioxygenase-like cupin family protein